MDATDKPGLRDRLLAPFPIRHVQWRVAREVAGPNGPAVQVLAYLDARAVEDRLDEVFGQLGWQTECQIGAGGVISCTIKVRNYGVQDYDSPEWISKSNISDSTDIEPAKGGYSTAFKRAAAHGLGIGRYLYELGETFAPLSTTKQPGSNWHRTKSGQIMYWETPALPVWAVPEAERAAVAAGRAAPTVAPQAPPPTERMVLADPAPPAPVERECPKCKGPMWDNRFDKRNPRAPDFRCKRDRNECDGAIWLTPR